MPVTRKVCLKFIHLGEFMIVFCDWLSIYQEHLAGCVVVNAGRVFKVDCDGVVQWDVGSKVQHKGSFDTSLSLCSDGHRVTLSGNIGRFNRQDNVFGYSVADCIKLANRVLAEYGLPPFTDSAPMPMGKKGRSGAGEDAGYSATGAVITRIDLTCNYITGSSASASQYIRHLQGFKAGKFEPRPYYTSGVSWGEGSKYWYAKVYDKAADYVRHYGIGTENHNAELYDWLHLAGVVRHEITLKSRYLSQKNLWRITQWGHGMATESKVYALFTDALSRSATVDEYLEIHGRAGELAVAWRDGADLKKRLSKATFYRYRKQLLADCGIDIAIPANVQRLRVKVELISVAPAAIPVFYLLPKVA